MNWRAAWCWVVAAVAVPAAWADDCAERMRIRFADGHTACLTDFPLSEASPFGQSTPVRRMIPAHGYYSIAAVPRRAHCPSAVGMDVAPNVGAVISIIASEGDKRRAKALQDCRLQAASAAPDCMCQELVTDAVSPLTVPQFAAQMGSHPSLAARLQTQVAAAEAARMAGSPLSLIDETCDARFRLQLADGRAACLTDFLLSDESPYGMSATVRSVIPAHGYYSIAAMPRRANCPSAVGLAVAPNNGSVISIISSEGDKRRAKALQDCRLQAASAAPDCTCQELITDGTSPMAGAQFVAMAGPRPELAARMQQLLTAPATAALSEPMPPAGAGPCEDRLRFRFADGGQGCLADFAMARGVAAGWNAPLATAVTGSGAYVIAASTADRASCPRAYGLAQHQFLPTQAVPPGYGVAERSARALNECQTAVQASSHVDAGCACRVVVADGASPLTRAEWEPFRESLQSPVALAQAASSNPTSTASVAPTGGASPALTTPAATALIAPPVSIPVAPAGAGRTSGATATTPSTLAVQPRSEPGAVPPPVQMRSDARSDATASELAALRQQIESLRAEMARAAASPGPSAVRSRPGARARALVIGNSAYTSLGGLPNPRRDAQAIAARFRSYGIEVDLALDTDRTALVQALTEYGRSAGDYDVNILFYAGHGVQVGGTNYIVPVDLPISGATVGSIRLNAVSLNDALEYLPARTRVVFLDACRDNPLSRSLVATRGTATMGLAPVNATSGTLVAYATKDGSVAEDGSGANSPYTTALLKHLDAEEDIAVVLRRVRESVLSATRNRQEPWEYGSLIGDRLVLSRIGR